MKQKKYVDRRWVRISSTTLNPPLIICLNDHPDIASLKKDIHAKHPQQPLPKDQLLTFRSNVLLDSDMVFDILEKTDNRTLPTFHLVVKSSLSNSLSSIRSVYISLSPNNPALTPVILPDASNNNFVLSAIPPATFSTTSYHIVAINGQFHLVPVLVPTLYPETGPRSMPMATRNTNVPESTATQRGDRLSWSLKLAFVLFIVCYDASLGEILLFLLLSVVFKMYRTGRIRFVTRREDPPPGFDITTHGPLQQQQQDILLQPTPLAPPTNNHSSPSSTFCSHGPNQPELNQNQVQPQTTTTATIQPNTETSGTQIGIPPLPTTTPQERQSLPDPEQIINGITITTTTRWSVLKRAVCTFIASLWPGYNGDLTGAAQN